MLFTSVFISLANLQKKKNQPEGTKAGPAFVFRVHGCRCVCAVA